MLAVYKQKNKTNPQKVERLYTSSDPAEVNQYQHELQALQKSPQSYDLASYLLQHTSRNCQYFGALTLSVVINSPEISLEASQSLISTICEHIHRLATNTPLLLANMFIMRKLMSNLSCIYIKKTKEVPNPVFNFLQALSGAIASDTASLISALPQLDQLPLSLLLVFFSVFIEDVLKLNGARVSLHTAIQNDIFPLMVVIYEYLGYLKLRAELPQGVNQQSLDTLSTWMSYIPNITGDARYDSSRITGFVDFVFLHLQDPVDTYDNEALVSAKQSITILTEIIDVNPLLLDLKTKLQLHSCLFESKRWGSQFMEKIIFADKHEEYTEETNAFVDLVLAFLQLNAVRLSKSILDPTTQNILSVAYRLTSVPGVPFEDEYISERMLVFWEELASIYEDSSDLLMEVFAAKEDPQFEVQFEAEKRRIFDEISRVYWMKLHVPEALVFNSIRSEFNSYRSNVADFFLVAYSLLKSDFYNLMTSSLIETIKLVGSDYSLLADAEATLYLLFKINEDTTYYVSQAMTLAPYSQAIFQSGIISAFKNLPLDNSVSLLFYATFIQYLASNEFFFKTPEGSIYLGQVLDLLFPVLMANISNISLLASKTATKICEECSQSLVQFLPNLELLVIEMLKNLSIDSLIRLRIFTAYSSIARRVDSVEEHAKILNGMISTIAEAANLMMYSERSSFTEVEEEYLISVLSCLVNIGKGSSLSDEEVEDLSVENESAYREYWQKDPLNIKQQILLIVQKYSLECQLLAQKTMIIENCAMVFRVGLGEKLGGPFEFGFNTIAYYAVSVMNAIKNTNGIPYVFGLIECVVSVNYRELNAGTIEELVHEIFTNKLQLLKTDPDTIKSAINLFTKMLEVRPSLIIHSDIFTAAITGFAIEGLSANESFLVKSVLKFWFNVINLKRGAKEDQERILFLFCNQNLGKVLSVFLVGSFFKAARSNLENYYSVFRALVGKYPMQFKVWLGEALSEMPEQIKSRINDKDSELFIHKLMITRGRRTANDVLKSIWLSGNGLVEYNTQGL